MQKNKVRKWLSSLPLSRLDFKVEKDSKRFRIQILIPVLPCKSFKVRQNQDSPSNVGTPLHHRRCQSTNSCFGLDTGSPSQILDVIVLLQESISYRSEILREIAEKQRSWLLFEIQPRCTHVSQSNTRLKEFKVFITVTLQIIISSSAKLIKNMIRPFALSLLYNSWLRWWHIKIRQATLPH